MVPVGVAVSSGEKTTIRITARVTPGRAPCAVSVSRCHSAGASGASGAASSRNALSVVQAVVLAGQLTVVRDNLSAW